MIEEVYRAQARCGSRVCAHLLGLSVKFPRSRLDHELGFVCLRIVVPTTVPLLDLVRLHAIFPYDDYSTTSDFQDARELQKQVLSIIPDMVTSVDLTGMSTGDDSGTVAEKASVLRESVHEGGGKYTVSLVTSSG